jgi:hypothetical protein
MSQIKLGEQVIYFLFSLSIKKLGIISLRKLDIKIITM